jgi:hypothetical protein
MMKAFVFIKYEYMPLLYNCIIFELSINIKNLLVSTSPL